MSRHRALVGFAVALTAVIAITAAAVDRFPMSRPLHAQSDGLRAKPGNGVEPADGRARGEAGIHRGRDAEEDPGLGLAEHASSATTATSRDVTVTGHWTRNTGWIEAAIDAATTVEIQARHERREAGGGPSHDRADLHPRKIVRVFCYSRGEIGPSPAGATSPEVVSWLTTASDSRGLVVTGTALLLLASPAFAGQQDAISQCFDAKRVIGSASRLPAGPAARARSASRGSWLMASANSDIYDFVTEQLAIDKSDFNTGSFAAEAAFSVSPRFDIVGAMDLNGMSHAVRLSRLLEDNSAAACRSSRPPSSSR